MERGEESGQPTIAKDLTRVTFVSLGKFFAETGLTSLKRAAQARGGDEEGEQQDGPLPSSNAEDDCADDDRGNGPTLVQAVGAISGIGDEAGKDEADEDLHLDRGRDEKQHCDQKQ